MRLEYRLTLNEYLAAMEADGKVRNPWLFKSKSPPISKRLYRWQISGNYKNDPRMHQYLTVELDENTIQVTSADATAQYQWKGFDYFIEADNVFNLYVSKKIFFLIPKRVFSNSEQLDIFRDIIIEKINNEPNFFRN